MSPKDVGLSSTPQTLLYQSGYLTIRKTSDVSIFELKYPNLEVKNAMNSLANNNFFNNFFDSIDDASTTRDNIYEFFKASNYEGIINILNRMLSGINEKHIRSVKDQDSGKKEDLYCGQIERFLYGAGFDTQSEDPSNKGIADIVAKRKNKSLVIEVKYVAIDPTGTISHYKIESECRDKLKDAVSQLYNNNYFSKHIGPMPLAIVIDESRATCISHAAYNQIAYRLDDDSPTFTKIGEVAKDGLVWKLSYTSEITASKKPLSPEDILKITMSKKAKDAKKTHSKNKKSSKKKSFDLPPPMTRGLDIDSASAELFPLQSVIPLEQYLSWSEALKGPNSVAIIDQIGQLKLTLAKTQSASFWHSLSQEEKNTAFQDAVRNGALVTLRYTSPVGIFFMTAIDIRKGEAIGLLVLPTHQCAYGPYPLSRLLDEGSELSPYNIEMTLKYICTEQFIDKDASLPTPEQLLKWNEN